jgi:hypothetical protein
MGACQSYGDIYVPEYKDLKFVPLPENIPYHPYVKDNTMKIILDNFP